MKKILLILSIVVLGVFSVAHAQSDVVLLSPLPTTGESSDFYKYIPAIFNVAIGIAGVLAVIMIVIGGLQYMSTDAISGKSEARSKITAALGGLLLALAAFIILKQINPKLVEFSLPDVNVVVTASHVKPKTCTVTTTAKQACEKAGGKDIGQDAGSCASLKKYPPPYVTTCCMKNSVGSWALEQVTCQ